MITILPSEISGIAKLPPSKSHAQRLLVAAMLANGISEIHNAGQAEDVKAVASIVQRCARSLSLDNDRYTVKGGIDFLPSSVFDCGESALCARLMVTVLSTKMKPFTITGRGSLLKRPVAFEMHALQSMGLKTENKGKYLPFTVLGGKMQTGSYQLDTSVSSQFASGMMMTLPTLKGFSTLELKNLKSRPYVLLTLDVMKLFGIECEFSTDNIFTCHGDQHYKAASVTVEPDWSSAAALMVAAALCGEIRLEGLNMHSEQADIRVLDLLSEAGVSYTAYDNHIQILKSKPHAFKFDFTNCPDLFPVASVLAAGANGVSLLQGLKRLKFKESDRHGLVYRQLQRAGIPVLVREDEIEITGKPVEKFFTTDSHCDHRMAMAFSVLALQSQKGAKIKNHECVNKSFPGFYETLKQLGGKIDE